MSKQPNKSLRVVLFGPPATGKSRHSRKLAERYGLERVEPGKLLRENRHRSTVYGTPDEFMRRGELVPDEIVNEIVFAELEGLNRFVLDGFPRTPNQAQSLLDTTEMEIVLRFTISDELIVSRLTGRRVCTDCERTYHTTFEPPTTEGRCDYCNGTLSQREDDTPPAIRNRIDEFYKTTIDALEELRAASAVVSVSAEHEFEFVWPKVTGAVEDIQ